MKVIIIEENYISSLEERVNKKLSTLDPAKIVDIKYSGCGSYSGYSAHLYSAMIILGE